MALEARVSTLALLHPSFRVHVVRNERVVCDDRLALRAFDRKGRLGRPVATLLLEGRAWLQSGEEARWIDAGTLALLPDKHSVVMRQEAEPRYTAIVVEWEPGTLLGERPSAFAVRPASLEPTLLALASELEHAPERALPALLEVLSALGLASAPFELPAVEPRIARVSVALDRALSLLDEQPMSVDLERSLSLSARQVNRLVSELHETYGFNAGTWRDARSRRRLLVAAALLSRREATLPMVAKAVGYTSVTALCRAFADAGLPSPASVSDVVDAGAHPQGS